MEFQNAYSESFRGSDLNCDDPSLAQQHFKDDVDINVLLERFKVTGQMPQGLVLPQYGDYTGVTDFRQAAESIRRAKEAFLDVPFDVRKRFDNDALQFADFCADPKNLEEVRKLGLAPAVLGDGAKPHVGPSGAVTPVPEGGPQV